MDFDPALVYHGTYTQAGGYAMARQALSRDERPTALFAANNFIAIGTLRALREAKLRVPEDIALVSFDDLTAVRVHEPFLTAVDHPAYAMGQKATALLLSRLSETPLEAYQEVVLPTKVIVRASSGSGRTNKAKH